MRNFLFRKVCEQENKSILTTQGRPCYFTSPLEIVLSIPLVGRYPHLLDVKGQAKGHRTVIEDN